MPLQRRKGHVIAVCHGISGIQAFHRKKSDYRGTLEKNPLNPQGTAKAGDVSAVIMQNLPLWAQFARTPSLETALMGEWEAKIEKMARETMNENVTCIAGVPTWTIVLLRRILELKKAKKISWKSGQIWRYFFMVRWHLAPIEAFSKN